jgi:queuosine precursor transporter
LVQLHLAYMPSAGDTMHEGFERVFALYPRMVIASLAAFFLSQQLDIYVYGLLAARFSKMAFRWRAALTMAISQTFDTLLFSYLALWGHMSDIQGVIMVSLSIKVILLLTSLLFFEKHHVDSVRTTT